jgi:hypothetical protein
MIDFRRSCLADSKHHALCNTQHAPYCHNKQYASYDRHGATV